MIEWSIDAFRACESVRSIVAAVPAGHRHDLSGHDVGVVVGGATRAQSVANALAAVDTGLVAIHDAARPLLTAELVEDLVECLSLAAEAAGAVAATPIADTIKRVGELGQETRGAFATRGMPNALLVEQTLERSRLWAAQTPQVFRTQALRAALDVDAHVRDAATDEAMLVEAAGGTVLLHPVAAPNFKVTTSLDLRMAELLLAERGAGSAPE